MYYYLNFSINFDGIFILITHYYANNGLFERNKELEKINTFFN